MQRHARHHATSAIAAIAALALAGCGTGSDYKNNPRPATPIVVTASISALKVSVSPATFGAGPVTLIVTNQTKASQQITLETDNAIGSSKSGFRQQTGPINPRDTAQLKADLTQGTWSVHVAGGSIKPARLNVGSKRPSAQNELLQP
ncbi:MAG TPA: hypothetical protein VIL64_02575 [Solirubrobacteraceae bacterium]|jgi:multidrug efflux pump subunit AcrA (membrane-fusion protein)